METEKIKTMQAGRKQLFAVIPAEKGMLVLSYPTAKSVTCTNTYSPKGKAPKQ